MQPASEILSFMDLLDVDEEIIDVRAKNIMERKTFANEHLLNLINLLQYKHLINTREKSECTNEVEYDFVGKLILNTNEDNIESVSKIIKLVLMLHPSSIINKSEHLIQQIISSEFLPSPQGTLIVDNENDNDNIETTLLQLKICVSILDAVILSNAKLTLPFLDIPLEHIIFSTNDKLQIYFLTYAVPRFFEAITGYNILDRIWNCLRQFKENVGEVALKVLCCLSNYYLPVADTSENITFESDVITHSEFWDFILSGLLNKDVNNSHRKKSIYLAKRAIDCVLISNKSINVKSASTFIWDSEDKINLKNRWDSYFILLDSLEEKQSNIVLPSLKIFDAINDIGDCWLNCAFHIALRHDNAQVRYQSLQCRLRMKITSELEAMSVLEAINDINLFEHESEFEPIKKGFRNVLKDTDALISILKGTPLIKWSPAPLYHLTDILSAISFKGLFYDINSSSLMDIIGSIIKIPCNNIVIRKAIHINMSHFIANNCHHFSWKEYMNIYPHLQLDIANNENPLVKFIEKKLVIPDTQQFLQLLPFSHNNIEFAISYFERHNRNDFLDTIDDILNNIQDVNSRQYSNKNECLNDVIFVVHLYRKAIKYECALLKNLNCAGSAALQVILQYVSSLLIGDVTFEIEKMTLLFEDLDYLNLNISNLYDDFNQLYKSSILLLNSDTTDLSKKTLSILVLNTSLKAPVMLKNYKQELLDAHTFVEIIKDVKFNENVKKENSGRLRNLFYEKSCEIVNFLICNTEYVIKNETIDYIYNVLDSGGYGCLKWILKIINQIIPAILDDKDIKFNVADFMTRMWKEIEELKSNSQYAICIQEFINIMTHDSILKRPGFNNMVILYSDKILELAAMKNTPLFYLVKRMNEINVSEYRQLYYVLSEILLYGVLPKKEHRISENMSIEILQNPYSINKREIIFNSHIKVLAVSILSKIDDPDVLDKITFLIQRKVEDLFKNKQRYYSNSLHDRSLQAAIQSLLFIFFKTRKVKLDSVFSWAINFLGRIPHQTHVRLYFEWYIALIYYYKGYNIDECFLNKFKENKVPLQSQFIILYWITTHKLKLANCHNLEFEVVMDFLFSNIMGPIYSTRLYAQYLSSKLQRTNNSSTAIFPYPKYAAVVEVIKKTLKETENVKDKSYMKLKSDYFLHFFDIIEDLTPFAIFWGVPQMFDTFNDVIETDFLADYLEDISECITGDFNDIIFKEWKENHKYNWFKMRSVQSNERKERSDQEEETQTIQKKYVPWKSMIDIDVYTHEKIKVKSELIVVASLIDKLPNLGGMARTSEVFGVQTYVVDSMRHLQDKQFQGLSVSAERWVNVEEVRPGDPLKKYLMMKKTEGYTVVAAEQTSSSTQLQNFKFPKKTLLLLGHEKEGIPCDLLPFMDHCVEIPQQGVIRSLNVHVTAAIFVWEYTRQNML